MSEYGHVFTTEEIKKQLAQFNKNYEGRKTWQNLYGGIDLARQQQLGNLSQDYSKSISDAYASSFGNKLAVNSSNLGQGYKDAAIAELDLALETAYDTYRNNYLSGISEVEQTAATATSNVDAELTKQAEYTKQFANAPYEYLQWLFEEYSKGEDDSNIFLTDDLWKRYTTVDADNTVVLKPWEELVNVGAYEEFTDDFGNVQKEWTGLFDADNNLTIKGVEFYDQMLNYFDSTHPEKGLGFGKWLSENNEDLFNWSTSYNPYNYTEAGSNLGSFKTLVGMTSTDQQYSFIERFGGMTKSEIDTMYSDFSTKVEELNTMLSDTTGRNSKKIISGFDAVTKDIKTITDQLGITEDIEKELGMSFDELSVQLAKLAEDSVSNGDIWWKSILGTAGTIGSFTITGAATGGIPGLIAGAIAGVVSGTGIGIATSEQLKAQNRQNAESAKKVYGDLVAQLVAYSHAKRRQSQSDFYKLNK